MNNDNNSKINQTTEEVANKIVNNAVTQVQAKIPLLSFFHL